MKTILIDDEQCSKDRFENEAKQIRGFELVAMFSQPLKALEYIKNNPVELVILDIKIPLLNGLELGKKIRELYPRIVIVFCTADDNYVKQAILDVKADGYIKKPFTHREIADMIDNARRLATRIKPKVSFTTFGNFDMYYNYELVPFVNKKAKELLALCVDHRGGTVTVEEAVEKLWTDGSSDSNVKSYYRHAVAYIKRTFQQMNISDLFEHRRGKCNVNAAKINCDYYDYLKGDSDIEYVGQYMNGYDWAELTRKHLEEQKIIAQWKRAKGL